MTRPAFAAALLALMLTCCTSTHAQPWTPDLGNGSYKNPIIHADYSDPDVIRVGDDFYLTASSFTCTPGLPILHSRDLVNWTIIGHAVDNLPGKRFDQVQHGCGVWAPAIRFHDHKFWIFFPMPDEGIYVTTAKNPRGPWTEPHLVQAGKGLIDPCPLWDDDGKAYLVHAYAGSRAGIKDRLRVRPMAPDGSRLLGEGVEVFYQPEKYRTLEGPKFMKQDGRYYILAPAGGVKTGFQVAFRSHNVYGPYEDKIVLQRGHTAINGPHQGALVDTAAGGWWFVHFQDLDAYGRIVHLQPVTWTDGWPIVGRDEDGNGYGWPVSVFARPAIGTNSPIAVPQTSDEFDSSKLGLQWQWQANHRDNWYSLRHKGWLRLFAQPTPTNGFAYAPNLLLQKIPAADFNVVTKVDVSGLAIGNRAGLTMMGEDYAWLAVERTTNGFHLIKAACHNALTGGAEKTEAKTSCDGGTLYLCMHVAPGAICQFSYSTDGTTFTPLGESFTARAGKWVGAKFGLFCLSTTPTKSGHADFDWLRVE